MGNGTDPEHSVGVGVVVGQVADITVVHESHSEGGGVVRLALHPACCLGGAQEVVAVVADVLSHTHPRWPALHRLHH